FADMLSDLHSRCTDQHGTSHAEKDFSNSDWPVPSVAFGDRHSFRSEENVTHAAFELTVRNPCHDSCDALSALGVSYQRHEVRRIETRRSSGCAFASFLLPRFKQAVLV